MIDDIIPFYEAIVRGHISHITEESTAGNGLKRHGVWIMLARPLYLRRLYVYRSLLAPLNLHMYNHSRKVGSNTIWAKLRDCWKKGTPTNISSNRPMPLLLETKIFSKTFGIILDQMGFIPFSFSWLLYPLWCHWEGAGAYLAAYKKVTAGYMSCHLIAGPYVSIWHQRDPLSLSLLWTHYPPT